MQYPLYIEHYQAQRVGGLYTYIEFLLKWNNKGWEILNDCLRWHSFSVTTGTWYFLAIMLMNTSLLKNTKLHRIVLKQVWGILLTKTKSLQKSTSCKTSEDTCCSSLLRFKSLLLNPIFAYLTILPISTYLLLFYLSIFTFFCIDLTDLNSLKAFKIIFPIPSIWLSISFLNLPLFQHPTQFILHRPIALLDSLN